MGLFHTHLLQKRRIVKRYATYCNFVLFLSHPIQAMESVYSTCPKSAYWTVRRIRVKPFENGPFSAHRARGFLAPFSIS